MGCISTLISHIHPINPYKSSIFAIFAGQITNEIQPLTLGWSSRPWQTVATWPSRWPRGNAGRFWSLSFGRVFFFNVFVCYYFCLYCWWSWWWWWRRRHEFMWIQPTPLARSQVAGFGDVLWRSVWPWGRSWVPFETRRGTSWDIHNLGLEDAGFSRFLGLICGGYSPWLDRQCS